MSYANILGPDGKISPAYLPSGGVATTLAAVCAQGNQTGSTGIVLGDGTAGNRQSIENVSEMDIVTLKVQQIEAYDPLLFPQVGVAADLVFADGTALEFEGDAVLNVPSGELKVTGIDDSSAAPLTNVLAYNTSTGEITYQPAGAGASTVNSVTNSDGSVTVSPTIGNVVVSLPATGSAGTYSYPTSLTTDAKGRVTAVTPGSAPTLSSVLTAGNVASDNIQMGGNDITDAGAVKALTVQISGTGGSLEMNSLPINNSRNVGTQLSKVGNNLLLLDAGNTQLGSAVALPSTPSLGDVLSVGAVASTNINMNTYNLSNAVTVNTTNLTSSEAEVVPQIHIKNRVVFDGASANEKILNMGGSGQITDCAVVSSGVGGMLLKASGTDGVQVSTSGGGAGILSTGTVRPHPAGVGSWTSESCASLGSQLAWNEGSRTLTLQSQTGAPLGSGVVISGGGGATPGLATVLGVSNSAGASDIDMNSHAITNVQAIRAGAGTGIAIQASQNNGAIYFSRTENGYDFALRMNMADRSSTFNGDVSLGGNSLKVVTSLVGVGGSDPNVARLEIDTITTGPVNFKTGGITQFHYNGGGVVLDNDMNANSHNITNCASLGSQLAWNEGSRTLTLQSQTGAQLGSGVVISGGGGGSQNLSQVLTTGNSAGSSDIDMNDHNITNVDTVSASSNGTGAITLKGDGGVFVKNNSGGAQDIGIRYGYLQGIKPDPSAVSSWTSESCASLGSQLAWDNGTRTLTLKSQTGTQLGSGVVISGGSTPGLATVLGVSNSAGAYNIDMNGRNVANVGTVSSASGSDLTLSGAALVLKANAQNVLTSPGTKINAFKNLDMNGNDITNTNAITTTDLDVTNLTVSQTSGTGYVLTDVAGTGVATWAPPYISDTSVSAGTNVSVTNVGNAYTVSASSGSTSNYFRYTAEVPFTGTPSTGCLQWSLPPGNPQYQPNAILLSYTSYDGVNLVQLFGAYTAGDVLTIMDYKDSTQFQQYTIQGISTYDGRISIAVINSAGTKVFPNNASLAVIITKAGGGGGGVTSIAAGTGITVNLSNPSIPAVSCSATLSDILTNGANANNTTITNLNTIQANQATSGYDFSVTTYGNNKILMNTNGGTTAMTIDNTQRVGIGAAPTSERLEVTGNIKILGSGSKLIGNVQGNVTGNLTGNADTATLAATATSATSATTATTATNVTSTGAGIIYNTSAGATTASSGLGTNGQLVQSTGTGLSFVTPSSLTVGNASNATFATSAGSASTATSATTATTATNLSSAGTGVPYQSAANTTAIQAFGTAQQLLRMNAGASALEWVSPGSLNVGSATSANTANTATNLAGAGGVGGRLLYQTNTDTTSILAAGTSGQLLQLVGNVPTWRNALVFNVLSYTATANPIASGANTTVIGTTSSAQFTPSSTSGLFDFTAAISLTGGGTYVPGTWRLQVLANTNSSFATGNITLFNGIPTYADFTTIQFSSRGLPAGLTAGSNYFIRISIVLAPTITGTLTATIPNSNFIFYAN